MFTSAVFYSRCVLLRGWVNIMCIFFAGGARAGLCVGAFSRRSRWALRVAVPRPRALAIIRTPAPMRRRLRPSVVLRCADAPADDRRGRAPAACRNPHKRHTPSRNTRIPSAAICRAGAAICAPRSAIHCRRRTAAGSICCARAGGTATAYGRAIAGKAHLRGHRHGAARGEIGNGTAVPPSLSGPAKQSMPSPTSTTFRRVSSSRPTASPIQRLSCPASGW